MPIRFITDASNPEIPLRELAKLSFGDITNPLVIRSARQIVSQIDQGDHDGELEAIFNAVKRGDSHCPPLAHGIRYTNDPPHTDFFTSPSRLLKEASLGARAEDCDGCAGLIAALCGAVGWVPGLKVIAAEPGNTLYTHVYTVVGYPKGMSPEVQFMPLDTTVPTSFVGWEPANHPKVTPLVAVLGR